MSLLAVTEVTSSRCHWLQIAAEVSQPLRKIDEIVMLGDDKVSTEVAKLLANLPPSVQALTGKDLTEVESTYTTCLVM